MNIHFVCMSGNTLSNIIVPCCWLKTTRSLISRYFLLSTALSGMWMKVYFMNLDKKSVFENFISQFMKYTHAKAIRPLLRKKDISLPFFTFRERERCCENPLHTILPQCISAIYKSLNSSYFIEWFQKFCFLCMYSMYLSIYTASKKNNV